MDISYHPATIAVAAGRPERVPGAAVNPPISLSSTYVSQGAPGEDGALTYARWDTESWHAFEEALGLLEKSTLPALVFSSGMAAVSACLSLLPTAHELGRSPIIIVPRHAYQGTLTVLDEYAARHGVKVRRVDIADTQAVIASLAGADMALLESPTNPMLEIADLPRILAATRDNNVLSIVDNTFATPLGQNPLAFTNPHAPWETVGADIVLHSATKYLSGHSDVVLGAVVTNNPDLREKLFTHRLRHGAIAGPFEVWLALRGLRTLDLRVKRAAANALDLALRLSKHPNVVEVRYPGLPSPSRERAKGMGMKNYGAIVGLRPIGGAAGADKLVAACQLWLPATSLGGVESSLERRRRFPSESPSVPADFLRLSVGVENINDLWNDLDQALNSLS